MANFMVTLLECLDSTKKESFLKGFIEKGLGATKWEESRYPSLTKEARFVQ